MTEAQIKAWAAWVKETCLGAGSEVHTAYTVAGLFAKGLAYPTTDPTKRTPKEGKKS